MRRLKVLRQTRNISQQRLAGELNLSQASISKYEKGIAEPDIRTLLRISDFFGVTIDYLLENSDYKIIIPDGILKDEERELLHSFRRLSDNKKGMGLAYIKGLAEQ